MFYGWYQNSLYTQESFNNQISSAAGMSEGVYCGTEKYSYFCAFQVVTKLMFYSL